MLIMRKNLILYSSLTGNTEMIAKELKKNFERYEWLCDLKKLDDDYDTD
ncbi:flavodoxin family protein, partial [Thermodesulfobacteriota bacterium]